MAMGSVRYFTSDSPAIGRTVRGKLERRRAELVAQLSEGFAQDWADYNRRAGVVRGLDEALQICIEVETELNRE